VVKIQNFYQETSSERAVTFGIPELPPLAQQAAEGLQISSVDVSGYGKNRIEVGAWNTAVGYRHVEVTSASPPTTGTPVFLLMRNL